MRKKRILTSISIMVMSVVSAQSDRVVNYSKPFVPEHKIRVGYSPFMPLLFGDNCQDKTDHNYSKEGNCWIGILSLRS